MRRLLLLLCAGLVTARAEKPNNEIAGEARVIMAVTKREKDLACVTPQAFHIFSPASILCGMPSAAVLAQITPHEDRFIKVYITPDSKQTLLEGKSDYPVGTLVVKEKSGDAEGKGTELFTAMIKRESGYNSSAGDWEFLVLDRSAHITASGKIDSCMECHQKFAQTGYLSRVYLQGAAAAR